MPELDNYLRNALAGMSRGPKPLLHAVKFYAEQDDVSLTSIGHQLSQQLIGNANDECRKLLHGNVASWDYDPDSKWTAGTEPNTRDRRERIYALLQIDKSLREVVEKVVPVWPGLGNVLIDNPDKPQDWYTPQFRDTHDFYWKHVRDFFANVRALTPEAIGSIEASTTTVMERLANPASATIRKTRGLVVGYVQSGKTTNFTGLVAKAVDAGYRLIIVLSGTTNLLRNQTQRRLDMDVVGRENILGGNEDQFDHPYKGDPDWPARFISYGKAPALLGHVNIARLTGLEDFKGHDTGLNQLNFEFEKKEKKQPLYERINLDHAGARIVVVKKNKGRLEQLNRDLEAIGKARSGEIPTIIIDDESDQAGVNTQNPDKATVKTRTAINEQIVRILDYLPRAQYIGYTATPFANVLLDLNDPKDIYPRHFMISLDRAPDYMGAREFHDFQPPPPGRLSNESAYVRGIPKPDAPADGRLIEALDAFVLTGAIKKFRESKGAPKYKHHTMLVHHSSFNKEQKLTAHEIRQLWKKAAYDSPGATTTRLKKLLEDFRMVWNDRGKKHGLKFPKTFEELKPSLGRALDDIRNGDPVLMVNSAEGASTPDFDGHDGVWKIIVGGAKLSRGYTVEGLTVSYFRRSTKVQDTLMQMGRWFGFRRGYQDLVRLYIGRKEKIGKDKFLDLYKAFEHMCRDEEDFRAQLAQYSKETGSTPEKVRALVFSSHPEMRPTAPNKMHHAELAQIAFSYREPLGQAVDVDGRQHNARLFAAFFKKKSVKQLQVKRPDSSFTIKYCEATRDEMSSLLREVKYSKASEGLDPEIEYLNGSPPPVDRWIVIAPQVGTMAKGGVWRAGKEGFTCIERSRGKTRFKAFSTPAHVKYADWLVGDGTTPYQSGGLQPDKRRGVLLFYPTREKNGEKKLQSQPPVMGFALAIAETGKRASTAYRTKRQRD